MDKPKICFISYFFPPIQAAGCSRVYWFVKEAETHGFDAFVITVEPGTKTTMPAADNSFELAGMSIYRTNGFDMNAFVRNLFNRKKTDTSAKPNCPQGNRSFLANLKLKLTHLLYGIYKNIVCFPDQCYFWKARALKDVLEIIEKEKPDIIYTTAPPGSCSLFGHAIKKKFPSTKWVADFRDLWSENEIHMKPQPFLAVERLIEKRTLSSADLIITTTPNFSNAQKSLHPGKRVETIYNGYDSLRKTTSQNPRNERFTILYTGAVYFTANRDMSIFFRSLERLTTKEAIPAEQIHCIIYGTVPANFYEKVALAGLKHVVSVCESIPRKEVLKLQQEADMLLLVEWSQGAIPIKLYEYLSTGLPVLSLANKGSAIENVLAITDSGRACDSVEMVSERIAECFDEWSEKGETKCSLEPGKIKQFSRSEQCKRYYDLVKSL